MSEQNEDIKTPVADIVFSFNNSDLILTLRDRGAAIAANDFDTMRKKEAEIDKMMENDFQKLTIPTSAFITFEKDDSAVYADMVENSNMKLLGQEFKFDRCSEPTDIIWENRHFSPTQYKMRELAAFILIGVLLAGSAAFIYWVSAFSAEMAAVFPPADCEQLAQAYGGYSSMQEYAVSDYDFVQANPGKQSSGCLQCFCINEKKNNADYLTEDYDQANGDKICEWFEGEVFSVYLWTSALSYLLIGINYILRTICIMVIDCIRYSTETERLSKTTTVTFITQYFNSAFLLLMVNADLSEQPISFGLTTGQLPDFNSAWFRSVGDIIVAAMVFNVYYPIIEVIMYWALRVLFRCLDRGCTFSGRTKSTSIQSYISIQQGPIYFMHFKYSSILTIAYITFMYGVGMPVLFPIALLSFLVLYVVEKMMLFYGYVMPPMYDERLSNDVLTKLQFAPLLYLIFGYWMVSNEQLLSNDNLQPVATAMDTYICDHTMGDVFSSDGWSGIKWPLMVTFIIANLIWYFGECLVRQLYECFPNLKIGDVEINEEIDNYWASLDDEDRAWSRAEESYARERLAMPLLLDDQYEQLTTVEKTSGKTLQGTHSFDILANPLYLDDFQYVECSQGADRPNMIIDDDTNEGNDDAQSDLVRVALNLAYLNQGAAKTFEFNKDWLTKKMKENAAAAAADKGNSLN